MKPLLPAVILAAYSGFAALHAAPPVVDPTVQRAAAIQTRLNVFLLLQEQPQTVFQDAVDPAALRLQMQEERYHRAATRTVPDEGEFRQASRSLDEAIRAERVRRVERAAPDMARSQSGVIETLARLGATRVLAYQVLNLIRAEIPASSLPDLAADPRIAHISLVGRHESQINVSVRSIGTLAFWNGPPQITGLEQNGAVLDSGVDPAHPAFGGRISSVRFLSQGSTQCLSADDYNDNLDRSGHGTHVAGIIASSGTTALPAYLGVAFQSNIFSIKVGCRTADSLSPFLQAIYSDDDLLQGLQYVVLQTPAKVINISMGRRDRMEDSLFNRTIDAIADTYGLTIVVSAGNLGPSAITVTSPGTAYNVITTGAFNTQGTLDRSDDRYAGFTSRGPTEGGRKKPDLAAPGGRLDAPIGQRPLAPCDDGSAVCGIYSTEANASGMVALPGTSMAAAHITGAALLLRQAGMTNPLALKAALLNTTDTVDWTSNYGWGYVNLQRLKEQFDISLTGSVPAGSYKLFRGALVFGMTATAVWNRRINAGGIPSLSNLDLSIYRAADNVKVAESASLVDNVEKTALLEGAGSFVIKLKNNALAPAADQPFALALSVRGFVPITGPALMFSCQAPYATLPGLPFTVLCSALNSGDAEAFQVKGTLGLQGLGEAVTADFGNIPPGIRVTRTYTLTAPVTEASYTVQGSLTSTALGEAFTANTSFAVLSSVCTYTASASPTTFSAEGGNGAITVTTQPGCPIAASSNSSWITAVNAGGAITFTVAANPGVQRTGSINAAGEKIQILQHAIIPVTSFTDVAVAYPFADFINLLKVNSVTSGCADAAYCPEDNTTRGQMAAFIIRSALRSEIFPFPPNSYFEDVATSNPLFKYIQKMRELGITSGCTATTFCPDALLTRGAMAVFLIRGRLGLSLDQAFPYKTQPYFTDVPPSHPFFPYIQKMRELGITSGCGVNTYCPEDWTTRGQMSVFLIRAFFTP